MYMSEIRIKHDSRMYRHKISAHRPASGGAVLCAGAPAERFGRSNQSRSIWTRVTVRSAPHLLSSSFPTGKKRRKKASAAAARGIPHAGPRCSRLDHRCPCSSPALAASPPPANQNTTHLHRRYRSEKCRFQQNRKTVVAIFSMVPAKTKQKQGW